MDIEILKATVDDAEKILALQKCAFRSEAELYGDYHIEPLNQTLEEMCSDFTTHVFLKAAQGDRIIGSVKGRMIDDGTCWIGRLMVHPDLQNQGIGCRLLREIEGCFPAAKRFELVTGHKSRKNICLYEKSGYRVFKQEKVNEGLSFVFMEKISPGSEWIRFRN